MAEKKDVEGIDRHKHGKLIELITNNYKLVEIGGKQVFQTADGEFLEYSLMEEEYFVSNWLAQFAVGHVSNRNYFNYNEWSRLTDGFTKGMIILNEDQQPVCIIRKFIDMDLSHQGQAFMDRFSRDASVAQHIADKSIVDEVLSNFAENVTKIAEQNPEYDTLTAMIPYEYYLRHGVDPTVVKQCIWIRDNYLFDGQPIDPDSDIMKATEIVLYKHARGEQVSQKESDLVFHLTNGDFEINGNPNKVDQSNSSADAETPAQAFDPLAD